MQTPYYIVTAYLDPTGTLKSSVRVPPCHLEVFLKEADRAPWVYGYFIDDRFSS